MKYLTLFLFATLAHADLSIRQITSEQTGNGYMFRWVQNGEVKCWAMGDVVDLTYIPPTWTPVPQAAIDYRWPVMTGDAALACINGPRIPRTVSASAFTFDGAGILRKTIDVPLGYPCGDKIATHQIYRAVHYDGQDVVGVCW